MRTTSPRKQVTDPRLARARWVAELRFLVDGFHTKDFFHGDPTNIICKGESVMRGIGECG